MSIWSTVEWIEELHPVGYSINEPRTAGSFIDIAIAPSHYGHEGIRFTLSGDGEMETEVVLDREQVTQLRDALTRWLGDR